MFTHRNCFADETCHVLTSTSLPDVAIYPKTRSWSSPPSTPRQDSELMRDRLLKTSTFKNSQHSQTSPNPIRTTMPKSSEISYAYRNVIIAYYFQLGM